MILFTKPIAADRLRMAYNNDIIRFYSNLPGQTLFAEVALRSSGSDSDIFRLRLYPDPQGKFFLNLKPYIISLINTRNFEDTLETNIDRGDAATYVYPFTEGTYYNRNLHITVMHEGGTQSNGTYNLTWLAGVEQLGDYHTFRTSDAVVLSPLKKATNSHYYLKYWQGYPFDVAFYANEKDFTLKNTTLQMERNMRIAGYVSRLFLSDGRTDDAIDGLLPLVEGRNELVMAFNSRSLLARPKTRYISIDKVPYKCGMYLKWLNKYGGYSYWLFENTWSLDRSSKYTGELDRDNANLDEMFARTAQLGKESQDTIKVVAEHLNEEERGIVEGLIDSPKIYLFTGRPFSRSSSRDWTEVTLKNTNVRLKNAKQPLVNFAFDFELPARYTQTL